jgi:hypothetical protein
MLHNTSIEMLHTHACVANIIYGPSVIPPSKFWTLAGDESFFSLTFQALLLHVCAGVAFSDAAMIIRQIFAIGSAFEQRVLAN